MAERINMYSSMARRVRGSTYRLVKNGHFNRVCDVLGKVVTSAGLPWKNRLSRDLLALFTTDKPMEAYRIVNKLMGYDRASIDWAIEMYIKYRPADCIDSAKNEALVRASILRRAIRSLAKKGLYYEAVRLASSHKNPYLRAMCIIDVAEIMHEATMSGRSTIKKYEITCHLDEAAKIVLAIKDKAQRFEITSRIHQLKRDYGLYIPQA